MTQQAAELLQKALSLSDEERASLAGSLLESLEGPPEPGAKSEWNQEIVRRMEEAGSGSTKTVSWEEVQRRIAHRLTHGGQG